MRESYVCLLLFLGGVAGCNATTYPPIPADAAKSIQSNASLADIQKLLGEPHKPTAKQEKQLSDMIARMPEPARSDAQKDRSLAWGNDNRFLAVKVNQQDVVWITSWQSDGSAP